MTAMNGEQMTVEPHLLHIYAALGDFAFGALGFTACGHRCQSTIQLLNYFFPENIEDEGLRRQARQNADMFITVTWAKAQLLHYGIRIDPNVDSYTAKALLLTSLVRGHCNQVPHRAAQIMLTLRDEYNSKISNYEARLAAWQARTFVAEVSQNPVLFVKKYFLNEDGKPDISKSPNLIHLPGFREVSTVLTTIVESIPALDLTTTGLSRDDDFTIIGWNREIVRQEAYDIAREQYLAGFVHPEEDKELQRQNHVQYMTQAQVKPKFRACDTVGQYFLTCKLLEQHRSKISQQLRLRIINGGRHAIFDLGVTFGLMVLGPSQNQVTKLLKSGRWKVGHQYEDSNDESQGSDEVYMATLGSRIDNGTNEEDFRGDIHGDSANGQPKAKRGRPRKHGNNTYVKPRLYFQWRGYNTVSGLIQPSPKSDNGGYIEFESNEASIIKGEIFLNLTHDLYCWCPFQGYRVDETDRPLNLDWNALSHLPDERVTAPRHMWF
ncbi:MAG: hypothetical protein Q9220_007285 [cf. Caloplaca sp. 1 TL-2023]